MKPNYRYWICQVFGWGLFAILSIYQTHLRNNPNTISMFADIIFAFLGLVITHIVRLHFYKNNWNSLPIEKLISRVIGIVLLQSFILGSLYIIVIYLISYDDFKTELKFNVMGLFFITLLLLFTWSLLYFIIKFIQRNRKLVIERLQMENSVKSLEIKNIKNNLQPHFIFNALNSIRALVDEDPNRARQSITQLSNILRSSIQVNKVETVPLKKELEIVQDYLSLEGIRYEERLKVIYNIQENTNDLPVPPLLLQTLVENAIKHGIAAQAGGGFIELQSFINNAQHFIVIRNTGNYNPGHSSAINSDGFGLESSQERLQFIFGKNATLNIKNESNNIVALTICLPIQK